MKMTREQLIEENKIEWAERKYIQWAKDDYNRKYLNVRGPARTQIDKWIEETPKKIWLNWPNND